MLKYTDYNDIGRNNYICIVLVCGFSIQIPIMVPDVYFLFPFPDNSRKAGIS